MDTLLTTRQLQNLLQVDRITIYRMLNDGRLQGFKVGGQWRFARQAVEQWLQEQQIGLEVTEPPEAADELRPSPNALPLSCVQAMQGIFAETLGLAAVTTTVDGTPVTPIANCCGFCELILSTEVGRQRCIASWRAVTVDSGSAPHFATCHAGLCYAWGRIVVQGQFVAAIYVGQFLDRVPADGDGWPGRIAELATATGLEAQRLEAALARVPVLDKDRQQQVPRLVQRVASTFSEIGEERLSLLGRLQRIAEITQL
jgi:excisionase family DNA binding protein